MGITNNMPGQTLARTIGSFQFVYNSGTLTAQSGVTIGLLVLNVSPALTATSAPNPTVDVGQDWLFRKFFPFSLNSPHLTTSGDRLFAAEIDTKSMRKLDEVGQTVWLITDTPDSIGCTMYADLRMLMMAS